MKTKKIIFSCIAVIILMFTFCINAFAVVIPDTDGEMIYIMPIKNYEFCKEVITLSLANPRFDYIPKSELEFGFLNQTIKDYVKNKGITETTTLNLSDGSYFYIYSEKENSVTVDYRVPVFSTSNTRVLFKETFNTQRQDLFFYFNYKGEFTCDVADYINGEIFRTSNVSCLLGNLFEYGSTPDDLIKQGYTEGYSVGLADGKASGGKFTQEDLDNAKEEGFFEGQSTNMIVGNAITGFFDSIGGFFNQFLNLGIGNITVFSILSLVVIGFLVMLIVKIIRG